MIRFSRTDFTVSNLIKEEELWGLILLRSFSILVGHEMLGTVVVLSEEILELEVAGIGESQDIFA